MSSPEMLMNLFSQYKMREVYQILIQKTKKNL